MIKTFSKKTDYFLTRFSKTSSANILNESVISDMGLVHEIYLNINGSLVSDLISTAKYSNNTPDYVTSLDDFVLTTFADNYGTRAYGWFIPTQSGNHTFGVNCDDEVKLYLSTNQNPANKILILTDNWVDSQNGFTNSSPINLVAGTPYYIELLFKEGTGGDFFTVRVTQPNSSTLTPIPKSMLGLTPSAINKRPILATGTASFSGTTFIGKSVAALFTLDTSDWAATGRATLDMGSPKRISHVVFRQRSQTYNTNVGNVFQGSNDNSNWTTLFTFSTWPAGGSVTTFPITNQNTFRYFSWENGSAGYIDGAYVLAYVYP